MDLWFSCSLWVHGSRTSALMSIETPCNCGRHILHLFTFSQSEDACTNSAPRHSSCESDSAWGAKQATVLDAIVEACRKLVSGRLTTVNMMNSLEYVMLALDELVDGGTILEIEGSAIAARVSMKSTSSDVPIHEQTPSQAFSSIKEQMSKAFKLPSTS